MHAPDPAPPDPPSVAAAPNRPISAGVGPWWPIALMALGLLVFWLAAAGTTDLVGPDESRYVKIGRELLERNHWLLLTLNGQPYNEKPPLAYWIWAGLVALGGGEVHATAMRLPCIVMGVVALLATYLIGRHRFGHATGLLAAAVLAATPSFLDHGPRATLDMAYTGWLTLALAVWLTRPAGRPLDWGRAGAMWAALALMFFTKGPIGLLIFFVVLGVEARGERRWGVFAEARVPVGLPLLGLLILGWFAGQGSAAGSDFVAGQVWDETIQRFLHGAHGAPIWYYPPRLFTAIFVPWAFVLLPLGRDLWRRRAVAPELRPLLWGWTLIPLLIFSLAHGKRQSYLLPLMPALALLVAWQLAPGVAARRCYRRLGRFSEAVMGLLAGALFVALILLATALRWIERVADEPLAFSGGALAIGLVVCVGLAALVVWLHRTGGRQPALLVAWAAGVVLVHGAIFGVIDPARHGLDSGRSFSRRLEAILTARGTDQIGGLGDGDSPELHVYGRYRVLSLDSDPETFEGLALPPEVVVGEVNDWEDTRLTPELAGYVTAWRTVVDEKPVLVLVRLDAAPTTTAGR